MPEIWSVAQKIVGIMLVLILVTVGIIASKFDK